MPSALRKPIPETLDPVEVDPRHYKVLLENDQVRVLQIHYGPHEKSPMHEHPATVAIFQGDQRARFHFPGGTSIVRDMKNGHVLWMPAETHAPENLGGQIKLILVELKTSPVKRGPTPLRSKLKK